MIVIRQYSKDDYSDLIESGYPFGSYFQPDFQGWVKNFFLNQREIGKFVLKRFFLNQEDATLVAYSSEEKKTVGVVTLRKITDNLWGIWDIFVSPAYRGRRIGSLLYQASFCFLKRRKIRKAIGVVSLNNIASVKSIKRNWQGFLSSKIFKCFGKLPIKESRHVKITVRKLRHGDEIPLFEIFKRCVGKQWCDCLEITMDNYLDRIFGSTYMEPVSESALATLAVKKNVFVAEHENELCGYAISREIRPLYVHYALLQFIPLSENFENLSKALLLEALRPSLYKMKDKFTFVQIGNEDIQQRLTNMGFRVEENLVTYNYL